MNNENKNLQHDFTDEKGNKSTVILESNGNNKQILEPNKNYKIVDNIKSDSNPYLAKRRTSKNILTSDIGVHSEGFAPIITLSSIIALSIIVVLYIIFRF
jgi:hypothetical protein